MGSLFCPVAPLLPGVSSSLTEVAAFLPYVCYSKGVPHRCKLGNQKNTLEGQKIYVPELTLSWDKAHNRGEEMQEGLKVAPIRRDDRIGMSSLGEYYEDILEIDARMNARSKAEQARTLVYAKIQEREGKVKERVQYLANKRGISFQEMWDMLLTGDGYDKITPAEYAEIKKKLPTKEDTQGESSQSKK